MLEGTKTGKVPIFDDSKSEETGEPLPETGVEKAARLKVFCVLVLCLFSVFVCFCVFLRVCVCLCVFVWCALQLHTHLLLLINLIFLSPLGLSLSPLSLLSSL